MCVPFSISELGAVKFSYFYFKTREEHEKHLGLVLELLKKEKLYAKFSTCEFWLQEVQYLGHVINGDRIHVDPSKIEDLKNWEAPRTPFEVRKAKKSVKLMMEKLFRMELELMLVTQRVTSASDPSENVEDEAVYKELVDSLVRAATTASSLEAEQDNEDEGEDEEERGIRKEENRIKGRGEREEIGKGKGRGERGERGTGGGRQDHSTEEIASKSTTTTTIYSQQSQNKGKGIMIEEPVNPMKKKDQVSFDEEVALKLQAEFDEEERLAREKLKKEKEANIVPIIK
ncbi:hypothetical protein Tco_0893673 [Tanacetum coccineum]|uniref:Reverse transcriptase domain-containing protein n=1 Tax=Tanacetum coccineum TaxID=301880 RepID=A0ABQ5C9H4_9ASTR